MGTHISFNVPYITGNEFAYMTEAYASKWLSGDGRYTKRCHSWLVKTLSCEKALLTHSCTAALEMSAILAGIEPGDEVIMPSFTFVSTANAFVLRGGIPVFVDIREDTLNIDESKIENAITPRTKAIVVVHYAGVSCEMDAIMEVARRYELLVIEDAAQAILSRYKGRNLGGIGDMGTLSFHETKNIISGEGGALLLNNPRFDHRAEIIREKGTNRSQFFRGEVDKYTWVDIGSSYLPSELMAAFLYAQLEQADEIMVRRRAIWNTYHQAFEGLENQGVCRRPIIPAGIEHNAHIYYLLLRDLDERSQVLESLKKRGVHAVFHYVPLHSSPAGQKYGRTSGPGLPITDSISDRVIRLPLWIGIEDHLDRVISVVSEALTGNP